jgi:hypothetical protein
MLIAVLVLLISCTEVTPYIPNDSTVGNMSVEEALKVFTDMRYLDLVFVDGQWLRTTGLRITHDRLIVTDETGKNSIFIFSKLPHISGGSGIDGHIELAGQPTFKSHYFDPTSVINALYVLKQRAIQVEKNNDEVFSIWAKIYRGEVGGIGIQLSIQEDMPTVMAVVDGAPASVAGIKVGDKISRIGDISTKGINLVEAVKLLRGPIGTEIMISIIRSGLDTPKELTLSRAAIKFVLSEDARKYYVQAEDALREMKFDDAADLYRRALNVDPW